MTPPLSSAPNPRPSPAHSRHPPESFLLRAPLSLRGPFQRVARPGLAAYGQSITALKESDQFCFCEISPCTNPSGFLNETLIGVRRQYYDCCFRQTGLDFAGRFKSV